MAVINFNWLCLLVIVSSREPSQLTSRVHHHRPCSGLGSSCRRCQERPSWEWNVLNLLSRWGFRLPKGFDRRWSPPTPHLWTLDPPGCSPPPSDQAAREDQSVYGDRMTCDCGCCAGSTCTVTRLWVLAETVRISFGFQMTISASDPTAMRPAQTHTGFTAGSVTVIMQ